MLAVSIIASVVTLLIHIIGVSFIETAFEPTETDHIHDAIRVYREVCLVFMAHAISYTMDRPTTLARTMP